MASTSARLESPASELHGSVAELGHGLIGPSEGAGRKCHALIIPPFAVVAEWDTRQVVAEWGTGSDAESAAKWFVTRLQPRCVDQPGDTVVEAPALAGPRELAPI